MGEHIDIVFDGPPGGETVPPQSGRFVEVENEKGEGISFGEWVQREDGYWCLRLPVPERLIAAATDLMEACEETLKTIQTVIAVTPELARATEAAAWEPEVKALRAALLKAKGA